MIGWVLLLVFVDELLAVAAAAIWGLHAGGVLLAVLVGVLVIGLWWSFASPKAPYGGPVSRPVVKVLVFTLASFGLWAAGHPVWAGSLFVFSLLVNGLAQLPSIRVLAAEHVGDDRGLV
jgi:hypothetical protein